LVNPDDDGCVRFTELKTKALQLRPAQRAKLVDALIQTLDKQDEEPISLDEMNRRAEELRSGHVKGITMEEMLASARRRIRG
jgi:putative addiction module component (TIGR02574 family)